MAVVVGATVVIGPAGHRRPASGASVRPIARAAPSRGRRAPAARPGGPRAAGRGEPGRQAPSCRPARAGPARGCVTHGAARSRGRRGWSATAAQSTTCAPGATGARATTAAGTTVRTGPATPIGPTMAACGSRREVTTPAGRCCRSRCTPTTGPTSVRDIAERTGLPQPYLEQILLALKGAGLVRSKRGVGGGYVLARPPAEIRLVRDRRARSTARSRLGDFGAAPPGRRLRPRGPVRAARHLGRRRRPHAPPPRRLHAGRRGRARPGARRRGPSRSTTSTPDRAAGALSVAR